MRTGRYRVIDELGRGGMGHVFLAESPSGERVALKRVRRHSAQLLRSLKREFRRVVTLEHPNLVRLFHLEEDGEGVFFTMELIDGGSVIDHCRPEGRASASRIAAVLPQIVDGLEMLHSHDIAHGDLSPTNILVRTDGTAKLVDFGLARLVAEVGGSGGGSWPYMAPEQKEGAAATFASDIYALGAVLHHILYGRAPLDQPCTDEGVLPELCEALLRPEPADRPSLERVREWLHDGIQTRPRGPRFGLVGRDSLLSDLEGRLIAGSGGVVLVGPSGVGKTAVADEIERVAQTRGRAVLRGMASPLERVPFNLFDALVDSLAARLVRESLSTRSLEAAAAASQTFEVLAPLAGIDLAMERARQRARRRLFAEPPPSRQRYADLARHLDQLIDCLDRQTLLILDDFHFADADSLALLTHFLASSSRSLLMLSRDHGALSSFSQLERLDLLPLEPQHIEEILRREGRHSPKTVSSLAKHCRGLPALACIAARCEQPGADDPLSAAIDSLRGSWGEVEYDVLAVLALTGRPIGVDAIADIVQVPRSRVGATLNALARRWLVRKDHDRVRLFHESLRKPIETVLGKDRRIVIHDRLSRLTGLSSSVVVSAERVRHLVGAGRHGEAQELATQAAEQAESVSAWSFAADMWSLASRGCTPDQSRSMLAAKANALSLALRHEEAANVYGELAAQSTDDGKRALLRLKEAQQLLAARHLASGLQVLDLALAELGEPGSRLSGWRSLTAGVRFLVGPGMPALGLRADAGSVGSAPTRLRIGSIVSYFDTPRGIRIIVDAHRDLSNAGAPELAAWADYMLAFFARYSFRPGLSHRYRRSAEHRLGLLTESRKRNLPPIVSLAPRYLDAYDALLDGRFQEAVEGFDATIDAAQGDEEAMSFEARSALNLRTTAVMAQQNVGEARQAVARFETVARDGMDALHQCHAANARCVVDVWSGRIEHGASKMRDLEASWPRVPLSAQPMLLRCFGSLCYLRVDLAAARRRLLAEELHRSRRFRILQSAYGPPLGAILAMIEVLALYDHDGGASPRRVRRYAALGLGRASLFSSMGRRAVAYLEVHQGNRPAAMAHLSKAQAESEALGQAIDAALAEAAKGLLLGARNGYRAMASARKRLQKVEASPRLLEEIPFG